ncbi:MAG: hypothetical protein ACLPVY_15435 [Acidimicrobiia bacterium]
MAFTMTVFGHTFDADLDDLADRLDALRGDLHGLYMAWSCRLREPVGVA